MGRVGVRESSWQVARHLVYVVRRLTTAAMCETI